MSINILAVAVAAVAQFIIGAVWYMPIFGKAWGEIHGFDKLTKEQQKAAQKDMMPLLGVQLLVTIVISAVLAKLLFLLPNFSIYRLVGLVWSGFVVPTQVGAVLFGGTEPKWVVKKTLIMAGGSLACLLAAATIINAF